jgi:SMP-30/Gluconolactonase/LRE-like region
MIEVTCVLDAKAQLGECPVWSAEEQALYWIDVRAPALHRLDPATGATRSWEMPQRIGSFGLREQGGAVVALVDGFHLFDFDTEKLSFLAGPQPLVPGTRFNDGKVSPDGRFWAGTMDEEALSRPLGVLYRLDPDGTLHPMVDGLIVSNGLAWSADGRTMFHSDSKAQVIWAYDYDPENATIANRRVVARRCGHGRGGLLLERWNLRRRAQPVGAGRASGPEHSVAVLQPDHAVLRRSGSQDHLRYLAAARPAGRGAGRQTVVGWHLRRTGGRPGRARTPLQRLTARTIRGDTAW